MASISPDANGNRRILFMAGDGTRKAIRLGAIPIKQAEAIKLKVEAILAENLQDAAGFRVGPLGRLDRR